MIVHCEECVKLQTENLRLKADLDAYYVENAKLKEDREEQSVAESRYIEAHQNQKEEITSLRAKLDAVTAELAIANDERAAWRNDTRTLQAKLDMAEKVVEAAREEERAIVDIQDEGNQPLT